MRSDRASARRYPTERFQYECKKKLQLNLEKPQGDLIHAKRNDDLEKKALSLML